MNLEQSMTLAALRTGKEKKPETRLTALQMARRVFKISAAAGHPFWHTTPEQWAKKWLSSPAFVLTEVETDKVALIRTPRNVNKVLQDMQARSDSVEPVVVDLNRNRLAAKNGYVPPVVAVDGAHRCYSQYLQGHDLMQAWVGTKALEQVKPEPLIEASAVDKVVAAIAGTKISTAATLYAAQGMPAPPRQDAGDGGSQPTGRANPVMKSGAPDGPDFIKNRGVRATGGAGAGAGAGAAGGPGSGGGPGASLGSGSGANPMLKAGGPGSGRHAEYGTFKHTGTAGDSKYYKSDKGTVVRLHEPSRPNAQTKVFESIPGETRNETQIYRNYTSGNASQHNDYRSFIKNRYGIDASVPAARSSGHLEEPDPSDEKVPSDPSDSGQAVEPSDQLQYSTEPQENTPGAKGWNSELRGRNNPVSDAPGAGVGPRLKPDTGASNSELRRAMKAGKDCLDCGKDMDAAAKRIKKMWTRFTEAVAAGYKPRMEMKAAPGWEGTVKKMKSHPEISNPWALSHWMNDQGYKPGGSKKAKA